MTKSLLIDGVQWDWGAQEHQERCAGSMSALSACHKTVRSVEDMSDGQHFASIAKQRAAKECRSEVKVRWVAAKWWILNQGKTQEKEMSPWTRQHQGSWNLFLDSFFFTSANGPVVAPTHVAVRHSETADALGALQFVTLVAGEMHCGSSPAVKLHRGERASQSALAKTVTAKLWECRWGKSDERTCLRGEKKKRGIYWAPWLWLPKKCCIVGDGCCPICLC